MGILKSLICINLIVGTIISTAQQPSYNSPKEFLLLLQKSKPDTNRIKLLYDFGNYYHLKKDRYDDGQKIILDSAITLFKDAVRLSDSLGNIKFKNESRCLLGEAYFNIQNIAEGRRYYLEVIKKYQFDGNKEQEAITWQRMGNAIPMEIINYDAKLDALEKALQLLRELDIPERKAEVLSGIATIHFDKGNMNMAENEFLEALAIYNKISYTKLFFTYLFLSAVNRYKGNFDEAYLYATKCVAYAEESNDLKEVARAYGELALVYQELSQTDESVRWYYKSLEVRERIGVSKVVIYRTAGLLIQQLIILNKEDDALVLMKALVAKYPPSSALEKATVAQNMGYCFEALKEMELAENYFLEMIKQYEITSFQDEFKTIANEDIGRFYLNRQQYDKAHFYLHEAISNLGNNPLSIVKDIYLLLFKADSSQGNYPSAIKYFQQYKILNDSIFNDKRNKQIEELQIKYETSKKQTEIEVLKNQNNTQENKLKSSEMTRNLTISGALILFVFFFYRYRLKQKTDKILENQQIEIRQKNISLQHLLDEKEWLVKEIHHRVKNNFHIVMGLLGTQSGYLRNEEAVMAIKESQHRIHVMSIIHQRLYQSDSLSAINMHDYIIELVEYFNYSYDILQKIRFKLKIQDIVLDHSYAIPLGLILNEAITNSIKYAFPENKDGIITISFQYTSTEQLELLIIDNGVGISEDFDIYGSGSMGMNLMQGLSGDIGAIFSLNNSQGTQVAIVFTHVPISNKYKGPLDIYQMHLS